MKTYKIGRRDLFQLMYLQAKKNSYDQFINNYLAEVILPSFSIDIKKGNASYNLLKGEVYFIPTIAKPVETVNTKEEIKK